MVRFVLASLLPPGARASAAPEVHLAALCPAASMNVALYAGIAGGLAAAIVLLGVAIYCCCCRGEAGDTKP